MAKSSKQRRRLWCPVCGEEIDAPQALEAVATLFCGACETLLEVLDDGALVAATEDVRKMDKPRLDD